MTATDSETDGDEPDRRTDDRGGLRRTLEALAAGERRAGAGRRSGRAVTIDDAYELSPGFLEAVDVDERTEGGDRRA